MKKVNLRGLIFLALCCELGLFTKRLIAPAANLLTDSLHVPGGVTTGFSLMFLVVAAVLTPVFGVGTLMGLVQSGIALPMGMVGSMGMLAPVGYILPGLVIDCTLWLTRKASMQESTAIVLANALASASASLTANVLVFHLKGIPLLLYGSLALTAGTVCGLLGGSLARRLRPVICGKNKKEAVS